MRVELCRREVGVSEHLLHAPQVGTAFEEVGRERVPQEVWVDAARLEPGPIGKLSEDQECAGAGQRTAAGVQKEVRSVSPIEVRPAEREIATDRLDPRPAERDDALLAALAENAHGAGV